MRFSSCKTIDTAARNLLKSGWVIKSKNKHVRLFNPDSKQSITVPGSPGDRRSVLNWMSEVKRMGVALC